MLRIYLVRHGQDEDNASGVLNGRRDMPLSEKGVEQTEILAKTIRELNLNIGAIYTSPLQRAYKTAEAVSDILEISKPKKVDLLIERDFGIMTGKMAESIAEVCAPDIIKSDTITYFLSPEGAETFPELMERGRHFLGWLYEENSNNENVLVVTHGDIGKMIYAVFYGLEWKDILTQFHFGNSEVLLLSSNSKPKERYVHKTEQYNH